MGWFAWFVNLGNRLLGSGLFDQAACSSGSDIAEKSYGFSVQGGSWVPIREYIWD